MHNFKDDNAQLLKRSIAAIPCLISDEQIAALVVLALQKSIKMNSRNPTPPLFSILMANDLPESNTLLTKKLGTICVFFYAAADLFDDVQDNETTNPIIVATDSAQAINIANVLLSISQQLILQLEIPDANKLRLLQLFLATAQTMSIGQFYDILTTNHRTSDIVPETIVAKKAGAELACFFSASALLNNQCSDSYYELGECFGMLLQVFSDYFDIWIPQVGQGVSQDLLILKNSFPIYYARQDTRYNAVVSLFLAGKMDLSRNQFQLRRVFAMTQAVEKLECFRDACQNRLAEIFQRLPKLERIQGILDAQLNQCTSLLTALKELRNTIEQSVTVMVRNTDFDLPQQMALDYLTFVEDFKDAWEVQRWGFLGQKNHIGNLFTPLLICESLLDAGQDISQSFETLLAYRSDIGWHYYTDCDDIPPDSDDLGQLLHIAGRLIPIPERELFKLPLQLLRENFEPSGFCPTWLCDNQRFKREAVNKVWFGNECLAVMANLYYGLAVYEPQTYHDDIYRGIEYLIARFDPSICGWKGTHYKSHLYTLYLVLRLLHYMSIEFIQAHLIRQHLLNQQRLNGSWNDSPQDTAFALLALFCTTQEKLQPDSDRLKSGLIYLTDTQLYDGSWRGEDLFVCPGQAGRYDFFNHAKITTSFCLRALVKAQQQKII